MSFREGPAVLDALKQLHTSPICSFLMARGWLTRAALACHFGLLLDRYEEPGPQRGDDPLQVDKGETIGAAMRTRAGTKPVFVSISRRGPAHIEGYTFGKVNFHFCTTSR